MKRQFLAGLLAFIAICAAAPAQAVIIFFTSEAAWSVAAGSPTFDEDFEGFAADTSFRFAPVALDGMTIQQEGTNFDFRNFVDVPPLQFTDNNGTSHASIFVNHAEGSDPGTQVRITFNMLN